MDIKQLLSEIIEDGNKPSREINKTKYAAKLATLGAELSDDATHIPSDVFELFDNDQRKIALTGFVFIIAQSLLEE